MNYQGGNPRQAPGGAVGVLVVVGGNDRGRQLQLENPTTQVGRGADQDLVLADIAVSRRHIQLLIEGHRYRLRDLGSGNGTLINGVRTATALLNDGDQIEIGNTLLRFEHPPSRSRPAMAPSPPTPAQAPPEARTMIAEAPVYPAPVAPVPAPQPRPPALESVQPAFSRHSMMAPAPSLAAGDSRSGGTGRVESHAMPLAKIALVAALALVVLVGIGLLVRRGGSGEHDQANRSYGEATKAFSAGDYEGAKRLFSAALQLDPSNTLIPRQLKQCDAEIHARGALKIATGLASDKRWEEVLKILDSIEKSSAASDEAEKLRKRVLPEAVSAYLAEARESLEGDPEAAKQKVEAALVLDPENSHAHDLADKLKGGSPAGQTGRPGREDRAARPRREVAHAAAPAGVAAAPAPAPAPAAGASGRPSKVAADEEEAPPTGAAGGADDVLASKTAAGPYRAKEFAAAAQALRLDAKAQKSAAAQKQLVALAAQVARLGDVYGQAEADKVKNPPAAVTAYQQALTLDAAVGKGTHAVYLKAQAARLAKDAARQAFSQQHYDTAFEMSKVAQRIGGEDGGVGAQLKAKASELNAKAGSIVKSNALGAKSIWRTVLRMVPPGDPSYVAATRGLAAGGGGVKDEDED